MNKLLLAVLGTLGGLFIAKAAMGDDHGSMGDLLPPEDLPKAPGKYEYEVRLAQGFNTAGEVKVMLQARFENVRGPWDSKDVGLLLFRFVSAEKLDGKEFLLREYQSDLESSAKIVEILKRTKL